MRELKFRTWYKPENKFYFGRDACSFPEFTLNWMDGNRNNYIIQQYTGLKDKEGNDVYEGDILHMGMGIMYVVEWSDPHATFIFKTITNQEGMYMIPSGIVKTQTIVYGNIFETPELLES